jgi:hypothetical protein
MRDCETAGTPDNPLKNDRILLDFKGNVTPEKRKSCAKKSE